MLKGKCPFCAEEIEVSESDIIQSNTIRRDVYRCPNCGKPILKCMGIGCRDFAAGGKYYDNNFCPECLKKVVVETPKYVLTTLKQGIEVGKSLKGKDSTSTSTGTPKKVPSSNTQKKRNA